MRGGGHLGAVRDYWMGDDWVTTVVTLGDHWGNIGLLLENHWGNLE